MTSALCTPPVLYLYFLCPGIDPFPQQPPAGQAVAIVTEVSLILASHVNGNDCSGTHVPRYVRCLARSVYTKIHTHTCTDTQTQHEKKSSSRDGQTTTSCFRVNSLSVTLYLKSHSVQTAEQHKNVTFLTCQTLQGIYSKFVSEFWNSKYIYRNVKFFWPTSTRPDVITSLTDLLALKRASGGSEHFCGAQTIQSQKWEDIPKAQSTDPACQEQLWMQLMEHKQPSNKLQKWRMLILLGSLSLDQSLGPERTIFHKPLRRVQLRRWWDTILRPNIELQYPSTEFGEIWLCQDREQCSSGIHTQTFRGVLSAHHHENQNIIHLT